MGCSGSKANAAPQENTFERKGTEETLMPSMSLEDCQHAEMNMEEKVDVSVDQSPFLAELKTLSLTQDGAKKIANMVSRGFNLRAVEQGSNNNMFHLLAIKGNTDALKYVTSLKCRANVNAQNVDGDTPLHLAIFHNHFECAIQLKIAGADENMANIRGFPARKGSDGDKCYGVCAMASAKTIQMVEMAFKICDSNFDDLEVEPLKKAADVARETVGFAWTEQCDEMVGMLINDIEKNKMKYVHDTSILTCNSDNSFLQMISCG
jgi:hypothetical protein